MEHIDPPELVVAPAEDQLSGVRTSCDIAFESGMAWVFRKCRHLTPNTALLVILGAVLWLPISFGAATAMHAVLFAKVTSWPAWMQLLHPLATVIAKSKLLVLPVYPAAWPQAKKHPLVQLVFKGYETIKRVHVIRKVGFRYRQAEIAGIAAVERLERTVGLASAVRWLRKAHVAEHFGVEKPTQKLRSFFSRWSIKFSAEYYEAKERQASGSHHQTAASCERRVDHQSRPVDGRKGSRSSPSSVLCSGYWVEERG